MGTPDRGPVRILVLHPEDVVGPTIGGVATFIRDFVRFSPDDLEIEVVGTTTDALARPVGQWATWEVGNRVARFLPLVKGTTTDRHSRVPTVLRFTMAMSLRRHRVRTAGRTLQFHRAEVPLAFLGHGRPHLQVIHVDVHVGNRDNRWRYLPGVYRRVEDLTIRRMDRVFVANEEGARFYQSRHPGLAGRVGFLSGWYDDTLFHPATALERDGLRHALAAQLGLPTEAANDRFVLFVGRLEVQKDPSLMIEAFAALRRDPTCKARLLVVGEGTLRSATERWAREEGVAPDVHFLGALPHPGIARLMPACDALILPSHWEGGGPRAVLEAMASGLPVVATVVGEVERVIRSGNNGWLASDRRPETLAAGLRWVLDQPRQPIAEAASAAAQPFAARRVLTTLYDAHRAIADRRPAA